MQHQFYPKTLHMASTVLQWRLEGRVPWQTMNPNLVQVLSMQGDFHGFFLPISSSISAPINNSNGEHSSVRKDSSFTRSFAIEPHKFLHLHAKKIKFRTSKLKINQHLKIHQNCATTFDYNAKIERKIIRQKTEI